MPPRASHFFIIVSVLVSPFVALLFIWIWTLSQLNPIEYGFIKNGLWPVACTTRGCITASAWARQYDLARAFEEISGETTISPEEALTSAIRQHLVRYGVVKSPVTTRDATRYRENILHITDSSLLQNTLGVSLQEYDTEVILPFLQQEALGELRHTESRDELYAYLSKERAVWLLNWRYRWNKETGVAEVR